MALAGAAPFRTGSGALGIAYVAAGRSDGYVERHMNAWDCLAAILIVREAGGYVSDFLAGDGLTSGNPIDRLRARVERRARFRRGHRGNRAVNEITLVHGASARDIARLGAELEAGASAARDLLWPGDPAIWPDISPILFPVVGWTRDGERVAGRHYPLGLHGFARFETFAVEASGARLRRG